MKKLIAPLAVALLTLAGCGGSVCERGQDAIVEKAKSCPSLGIARDEASIDQCEAAIKDGCSGDDIAGVNKAIECINDMGQCVDGEEWTFAFALSSCYVNRGISQQCIDAVLQ